VAVVFVYCNFKANYNILQLLEALLKQLAHHRLTLDSIKALKTDKDQGCRPSLETLMTVLETEIKAYSRVFVVVDALDECFPEEACNNLLERLRSLTKIPSAKLMVTSRDIPSIESAICADVKLEIIALDSDIKALVEARISEVKMLERLINRQPSIKEKVVMTVVEKAQGMCVAFKLPSLPF